MRWWLKVVAAALLLALAVLIGWPFFQRPPEPAYNGKTLRVSSVTWVLHRSRFAEWRDEPRYFYSGNIRATTRSPQRRHQRADD